MGRQLPIQTDFIRLDALLKYADLVSSGSEAKRLIGEGAITINEEVCTMRGKKCRPGDVIKVRDIAITVTGDT